MKVDRCILCGKEYRGRLEAKPPDTCCKCTVPSMNWMDYIVTVPVDAIFVVQEEEVK